MNESLLWNQLIKLKKSMEDYADVLRNQKKNSHLYQVRSWFSHFWNSKYYKKNSFVFTFASNDCSSKWSKMVLFIRLFSILVFTIEFNKCDTFTSSNKKKFNTIQGRSFSPYTPFNTGIAVGLILDSIYFRDKQKNWQIESVRYGVCNPSG